MHARRVGFQRLERIGYRLENLVIDFDQRRSIAGMKLRIRNDHGNEVADATRELPDSHEDRKVGYSEAGPATAGHIARREDTLDTWTAGRGFRVDGEHLCPRMLREHHGAVQHAGHLHVVHVWPLAEYLLQAADARVRFADAVTFGRCELELRVPMKPELFAEEGMAARLGRQRAAVVHRLTRRLDRIDDPAISRAAADVAVERFLDRLAIVRLALLNEVCGADHNAGNAEAALDTAFENERFANDSP